MNSLSSPSLSPWTLSHSFCLSLPFCFPFSRWFHRLPEDRSSFRARTGSTLRIQPRFSVEKRLSCFLEGFLIDASSLECLSFSALWLCRALFGFSAFWSSWWPGRIARSQRRGYYRWGFRRARRRFRDRRVRNKGLGEAVLMGRWGLGSRGSWGSGKGWLVNCCFWWFSGWCAGSLGISAVPNERGERECWGLTCWAIWADRRSAPAVKLPNNKIKITVTLILGVLEFKYEKLRADSYQKRQRFWVYEKFLD